MFSDALEEIFDDLNTDSFAIICEDAEARRNVLLALQDNGVDIHASMDRSGYIDGAYAQYNLNFMVPVVSKSLRFSIYQNPIARNTIHAEEFLALIQGNEDPEDIEMPDIQSLLSIL